MDFTGIYNSLAGLFPAYASLVHAHPAPALAIALLAALVVDVALGYLGAVRSKTFDSAQALRFIQTQFATKTATALATLLFAQAATPGETSSAFAAFFILVGLPKLYQILADIRDKLIAMTGLDVLPKPPSP